MSHKKTQKKGLLALSSMAVIILWAVGTVILLVTIALIINKATSATQEVACRNSVALRAKATITIPSPMGTISEIEKFTPLVCEAQNIGKLKGTREEIKHQIAELSAKCWWMYLEGSVPNLFDAKRQEESCGICYYFQIPDDMDPGIINTEFVHFKELTQTDLSQLSRLENDQDIEKKLEESIEQIEYNTIEHDGQQIIRPKNMIFPQEIYNFLLIESYDPKILYGGGSIKYFGNIHNFESVLSIREKQEISLRTINSLPPTQLIDYTYLITQDTQEKITEFGTNLYRNKQSILLVIVADEIERNDKTDARRLIERLNMNSKENSHDAILITVDIGNGQIRAQLGNALERNIKEHEVSAILEKHFNTIRTQQELNRALQNLIIELDQKIIQETRIFDEIKFPEGTYYKYLSNDQTTVPIIELMESDRTYAIMYKSMSDYRGKVQGMWLESGSTIATVAGGVAIVGGIALSLTGAGATIGLPLIKAGTLGIVAGTTAITATTSAYYFLATDANLHDGIKALRGRIGTEIGDNAVFIVPASSIAELCTEV